MFTCVYALIQESALHWISRQIKRHFEVILRGRAIALAEFKLAKRRMVEGIIGQPLAVVDRANLIQTALCTFVCDIPRTFNLVIG